MKLSRYVLVVLLILLLCVGANAQMPLAPGGLVQINPPFEGAELIWSSATINAYNWYGEYRLDVVPGVVVAAPNDLLDGVTHQDTVASAVVAGDVIIGTVAGWDDLAVGALGDVLTVVAGLPAWAAPAPPAGNALLDGVVHTDTVAQGATRGSLILADATPDWNELVIGANATILTSDGVDAAWAAPVVQTSTLLDGVVHTDTAAQGATLGSIIVADATPNWNELNIGAAGNVLTVVGGTAAWAAPAASAWVKIAEASVVVAGADYTARGGGAVIGGADDVVVLVTCRSTVNSGVVWVALSHPTPVAGMVTYYWVVDGGNLEVHIVNDSQIDIMCTVQYNEL